ncbi:MAG: 6-phospho-3-hexuloisomerase [Candidatus Altiarchaeales archaeon]|nr:MAG: 6-phospho-3-hexuloisomerase [Candidatus Altiarchaeales archaeon]RLI95005.1 MAG: 6-phospho-3-hexuloisomerase [Candidatus Altiarchaeales archaeon]HDO82664.1 6-phospho-3-hexuloisomerase [Candidatus Altiarchaeales archaeon]HEX55313.1 6-phospho-3-hexuloisomerase [Candidatus Altiarchaeales archaeon]
MAVKNAMQSIVEHVRDVINEIDDSQVEQMINAIQSSERIFIMGAGRSGLVSKAFAMRLVQLGLTVYVIGETVTPAVTDRDLFIAVSGSGATDSVVHAARTVKKIGAKVLAITSYPDSELGRIADYVVKIRGRTKIDIEKDHLKHQIQGTHSSLTPLGTLFEDSVMIFFDGIVARLMMHLKKGEMDMKKRHATLE